MTTKTFSVDAMACEYHVYQNIWDAALREQLPQGGLEIPCMLMFEGVVKDVAKVSKLVTCMYAGSEAATKDEPPKKRKKSESQDATASEAEGIISAEKLSDLHINPKAPESSSSLE